MRCITGHVQAILVGSGWHPSLFRLEMEILCKVRPYRFGTRVVLVNSNYNFMNSLKKSATLDECLSPYGLSSDFSDIESIMEGWIMEQDLGYEFGKSIAVRWIRIDGGIGKLNGKKLANHCGRILKQKGWHINLEFPDVELVFVLDGISEHIFWGIRQISKHPREGWNKRAATERPFFKPISLDPRLARVALNLVIEEPDGIICDPMCGTGGVILEGSILNQNMVGIDLDKQMVSGTNENLNWLNKFHKNLPNQQIIHGNAINCAEILKQNNIQISGLVFDPPYGKNAWKSDELRELFSRVLTNIRNAPGISLGSRLVSFLPIKPGINGKDESIINDVNLGDYSTYELKLIFKKTGWSILSLHEIPVHGSLARILICAEAI
tara:strand:+ start:24817 stop:25959 length:1143 start_codon:yes stop_codon:yes gene_type:complete